MKQVPLTEAVVHALRSCCLGGLGHGAGLARGLPPLVLVLSHRARAAQVGHAVEVGAGGAVSDAALVGVGGGGGGRDEVGGARLARPELVGVVVAIRAARAGQAVAQHVLEVAVRAERLARAHHRGADIARPRVGRARQARGLVRARLVRAQRTVLAAHTVPVGLLTSKARHCNG